MSDEEFRLKDEKFYILEVIAMILMRLIVGVSSIVLFCKFTYVSIWLKVVGSIIIGICTDYIVGLLNWKYANFMSKYSPEWKEFVSEHKDLRKLFR